MGYAEAKDQGSPIGSGVVEATCKTLVTERLKRSGMRWSERGGQAILTLRALLQSHRFESGWSLLLQTYRADVSAPDNVVPCADQESIKNDQFRGHTRSIRRGARTGPNHARCGSAKADMAVSRSRCLRATSDRSSRRPPPCMPVLPSCCRDRARRFDAGTGRSGRRCRGGVSSP